MGLGQGWGSRVGLEGRVGVSENQCEVGCFWGVGG